METKKTIIITGANSGLGLYCAINIAKASPAYQIILACRDLAKAEQAKGCTGISRKRTDPSGS